jgi:hypothetical protein
VPACHVGQLGSGKPLGVLRPVGVWRTVRDGDVIVPLHQGVVGYLVNVADAFNALFLQVLPWEQVVAFKRFFLAPDASRPIRVGVCLVFLDMAAPWSKGG